MMTPTGETNGGERRDLAAVLVEFSQLLQDDHDAGDILRSLGDYCTELLPVHGVGVLIAQDGPQDLLVATANTPLGQVVEDLEAELGEGPCNDALRLGQPVLVPDLALAEDRYPRFVPLALEAGLRSVHGLPLATRQGGVMASLDIVALEPVELTQAQIATAQLLGDVAMSFIVNWSLLHRTSELAGQLQTALHSRIVIEQAKGMLAQRHGESLDVAFERVRSYARSRGLKLRDVARAVVERRVEL